MGERRKRRKREKEEKYFVRQQRMIRNKEEVKTS